MQNKEITTINQEPICSESNDLNNDITNPIITTKNKSADDENTLLDKKNDELEAKQKLEKLIESEVLKPSEGKYKETPLLDELTALHSLNRLTDTANCKDIARYARNDMQPKNFIERILIDQITVTHVHGLKMISRLEARMKEDDGVPTDLIQKRMNLSVRMFETSQKAALALNKLRGGGTQTVVVKHQNVQVNGGQTVITDNLVTKGGVANDKR